MPEDTNWAEARRRLRLADTTPEDQATLNALIGIGYAPLHVADEIEASARNGR